MQKLTPKEKIDRSSIDLISMHPFWGYLLASLETIEDQSVDTAWTDGVSLGWNPEYISTLSLSKVRTLLAHEASHNADGHPWRIGKRDEKLWNQAADYSINPTLRDAGFEPIEGWLLREEFAGKPPEYIYARLLEEEQEKEKQSKPDEKGAQKPGADKGGESKQKPEHAPEKPEKQPSGGKGKGEKDENNTEGGGQGDEAGTDDGDAETDSEDSQGTPQKKTNSPTGEVRPAPAGAEESGATEASWQQRVMEAANAARQMGKLPSHVEGQLEKIRHPKMDWREVLQRYFTENMEEDYNWSTPDPDFIQMGLYLPDLYSEQLGEVVFVADVSGSISANEFTACASEVMAAIKRTNPIKAHVIQFDTAIRSHQELEHKEELAQVRRKGAGGTLFSVVFKYIEDKGIRPAVMVFLTDLAPADGFPERPLYPVLWVSVNEDATPPWGEVAHLLNGGIDG